MRTLFLISYLALVCGQCPSGFSPMNSNPNKCVTLVTGDNTSEGALTACQQLNPLATLLSIESSLENNETYSIVRNGSAAWIGLTWNNASGSYNWRDGAIVSYLNVPPSDLIQVGCGGLGEEPSFLIAWTNYFHEGVDYNGYWFNCTAHESFGLFEYRLDISSPTSTSPITTKPK